jgi:aspartate aminotransferase
MTRRLASRLSRVSPSATLALKAEADRLRLEGRDIVDFGPGEPDFDTPRAAREAGVQAIQQGFTHYTTPAGIPELRRAIGRQHASGDQVGALGPEEVLVGAGGKSILFAAAMALVEADDEVVIFAPYWVSFPDQVRLAGGQVRFAACEPELGFAMTARSLEAVLSPRTRMVIINSPCNPTGAVISPHEAQLIAELVVARDLWLVSDETYALFVYDAADRFSWLSLRDQLGERLIVAGSLSKTYAMTGWRVGYALAAPAVIQALLTIQGHDTTQAASISQRAALAALQLCSADPHQMLAEYAGRRQLVVEALQAIPGVRLIPPRGAFYAFPDVRELMLTRGYRSSEEFCSALLAEHGVALVPGEAFGAPGFVRLSYATSIDRLTEGLARMTRCAQGARA